jgi:hypothetical protein
MAWCTVMYSVRAPSIDFPNALNTAAGGISSNGEIAGYYESADSRLHGFVLRHGIFTSFDVPNAVATGTLAAFAAINPQGNVVGSYQGTDGKTHGYLFTRSTFISIDVPGAILTEGNGINPQGEIVGRYVDSAGKCHGFLMTL